MLTWFEDMEVTRFLLRRHPPSVDEGNEWLDKMARSADDVVWVIEHEGRLVGTTAIHGIHWRNGFGTTGTVIGDKSVWGKGRRHHNAAAGSLRVHAAASTQAQVGLPGGERGQRSGSGRGRVPRGGPAQADIFVDGQWRDHVLTEVMREDWLKANSV